MLPAATLFLAAYGFSVAAFLSSAQSNDLASSIPSTTFEQSFSGLWGRPTTQNGVVQLKLDRNSGSGFKSIRNYYYGFFSALIKLPPGYSAGVVTAFYASNEDQFRYSHDEIDFEFLGVVPGNPYVLQTNFYGDGSVNIGREERVNLWFDATADYHRYSVLWKANQIVFFVDEIPVRQVARNDAMGNQYPSKAMKTYGTIWDGSPWATDGGRSPVNYDYSPFIASFTDFKLQGCEVDANQGNCSEQAFSQMAISTFHGLDKQQKQDLAWVRANHLSYSYCDDRKRYPTPPPECISSSS